MIRTERFDELPGVGVVVLDRPDQRNAMDERMLRDLSLELGAMGADETVRCVVLRGEGRVFSAGFDLPACLDDPDRLHAMLLALADVCATVKRLRVPVVCAAHGAAIAGACALASSCDLVITDRAAKIGYPVVTIGVSPAISGPTLERAVGAGRARERLLDPALITGERAREIGLASLCVDLPEDVTPRAHIEAKKLADKPAHSVQRTKAWMNEVEGLDVDDELERARDASLAIVGSEEQRRLLASVLESRKK
ncbi:MAG: enoyl-CoA hydratase/isomerase family protein [Planctomycetota bacterium]